MKTVVFGLVAICATGCASPFEADPVSVYQWDRRQQEIERRSVDQQRLCQTMDKQSARYERECAGVRT